MNDKHGIRIIFKRDTESSIGRGAVIYRGHFRPEMARIIYWAAYHAPKELRNGEMWVTEGWRDIRSDRDLHEEMRAVDIDCMRIDVRSYANRFGIAQKWASLVADELGPDYQVILHGGESALHLHIELDP